MLTILRTRVDDNWPETALKQGTLLYLVQEKSGLFAVVQWDRVKWVCSCSKKVCSHMLAVNDRLTKAFQERLATANDGVPHVEDDLRLNH